MKKIRFLLIILYFFLTNEVVAQQEPYILKYNRIDYFAPASPYLPVENKTMYLNTRITIDTEQRWVEIVTYYSDGPVKSKYEIKSISDLKDSRDGRYFTLKCQANNYAEVVIDVSEAIEWVRRTIPHNGITHKYYSYSE